MRYKAGDVFPQLTVTTSKGANLTIPVAGANYTHIQFRRFPDARFAIPTSRSFAGA